MKKVSCLLLVVVLTIACTGCVSGVPRTEYNKVVSELNELKARMDNPAANNNPDTPPEKEPPQSSETETPVLDLGSRKNPAKVGDTITYTMDSFVYGKATMEITMTDYIRGEEAANLVATANSFNSSAPEGQEYIVMTVEIKNIKDLSSDDTPLTVNNVQFDYADESFAKESQFVSVVLDDVLGAELFEEASTTGLVVLAADVGEPAYAVYMDTVWFALD